MTYTDTLAALEIAWGIIANAGGGDWTKETEEWQVAAARWRDDTLPELSAILAIVNPKEMPARRGRAGG